MTEKETIVDKVDFPMLPAHDPHVRVLVAPYVEARSEYYTIYHRWHKTNTHPLRLVEYEVELTQARLDMYRAHEALIKAIMLSLEMFGADVAPEAVTFVVDDLTMAFGESRSASCTFTDETRRLVRGWKERFKK